MGLIDFYTQQKAKNGGLLDLAQKPHFNLFLTLNCLEGIIKKISYERSDYESVDEKSLSWAMSRKTTKKIIQAVKG